MNDIQNQIDDYMKEAIMDSQDIYLSQCWEIVKDLVMWSVENTSYEKVGYLHTLHKELDQSEEILSFKYEDPCGVRGENYSSTYRVTTKPVFVEE